MQRKIFLKNVAVISAGGLIAKIIGALYRIPLTNLLGGYAMGLYQMAYPLFCVLLTFSSTGVPSAFARIIAKETVNGRESGDTVKTALRLFAVLGAVGTVLMCLIAPFMSALQGDDNLLGCYRMLAPSVLLVALIAVFRGYFQGKNNMKPTAVSEIVEQVFKAGAGLFFALRYAENPTLGVKYSLLAVTLSEAAALFYLAAGYRGERVARSLRSKRTTGGEILVSALPVMAAASLLPLSQMADSVAIVRLLGAQTTRAVSLYGLFAGGAVSLISLPATACCGLATASVPSVSAYCARGEEEKARDCALYALAVTFVLAVPCAIGLFFLAKPVVALLYPSLSAEDARLLVSLLKLLSVSAASLAGVDTLAACLTGMGRAHCAALSMLAAVLIKFALQWALVGRFSVLGAAVAANACYLVAFFLDLFYTVKKKRKKRIGKYDNDYRTGNGEGRRDGARDARVEEGGQSACAHRVASLG